MITSITEMIVSFFSLPPLQMNKILDEFGEERFMSLSEYQFYFRNRYKALLFILHYEIVHVSQMANELMLEELRGFLEVAIEEGFIGIDDSLKNSEFSQLRILCLNVVDIVPLNREVAGVELLSILEKYSDSCELDW